ncbi:hypothetical protein C2845_PM14G16610 [Panicum miliaceum]|uniref:Cytochrome b5 heme-binding domain-containing protein n=1 Tax=Panicum miliaceum TaxID=4540 RepID=A0A3L6PL79_PANMI|nr:hypothetical protein C2845_PM14G16610 [Panicum miliaceum]
MAASVEPTHLARLEPSSAQMQAFMNGTRAYPSSPRRTPRLSDRGITALVSSPSQPWDEDDDDEQDWRELYSSHLQLEVEPAAHDRRDVGTADAWVERNPSLIRLTGKHPLNCEPPLARLMRHGFITPAPLHYVRNHGAVPRADWAAWTVEVAGLVRRPARLTMEQLVRDFPAVELPVTLVCSSNRRGEQNMVRQTVGFNWGPTAVSTSVWRGARLRDVLRRCGIVPRSGGALNVCFEGADGLPGGGGAGTTYGTSIRREWAMDPTMDVMLAYMQNGAPLPPDHGFPVRVVIPGCTAGRMVKWLRRIVVTTAESDNYYHYRDNRFLPSHVDAELADAEGENLNFPKQVARVVGGYTVKGYAYSGGGKKVTRVEVTLDGGETWLLCELNHPEKPTKYGKYWCWCFWSVEVEVLDLLGAKEIAVRAWDQSLNTQPEKLVWNLMGMMNNCWFRVTVNVCQPRKGEIGLVFEHPTQPGNQPGGWMARMKRLDAAEAAATALKRGTPDPPTTSTAGASKRFTMAEVREHASRDSAWIVVHGSVYDCTAYLKDHPGGADSILINAGTDCTEEFDAIHSDKAKALLDAYRIGELVYLKDEHPKFPDGGLMTQYLESLPIGSYIDVKGPLGHVEYTGRGEFLINGEPRRVRRLAMVAGGSGIAPMYQVIQAVLRDQPEDETEMHLVYANRTEEDILLRGELDRWAAEFHDKLKVWYVVDQVKRPEEGWGYSVGFVTEDILREHVPEGGEDALALACGPPAMIQHAVAPNLEKMKYHRSSSFVVF